MTWSLMSLILAIDQSTSGTKAVLFDAAGKVLAKASREHRQIYPQPGWVEHDADEIWRNVLAVIRAVARRHPKKIPRIAALSLTNQRETILIFDRQTGRPLHHALVWQDRRGDVICRRLQARGHETFVHRKTGLKIDAYFSASKLKWLLAEKPALAAQLRTGRAVLGTIDTYLVHRLTGGKVFATDFTNASRTLLFDIGKLRWDQKLCRLFGVPLRALPEVRESSARFGETTAAGILPLPVPITGVMGDSQASLFAQRCYRPGMAKATFGSGTSVLLNLGGKFRSSNKNTITALAWVRNKQPVYAAEGIINFSAATISWLQNQLGLIRNAAEVEKLARSVPDNGGVYLVPAFAGLSAPHWSPTARAALIGMTAFTNRAHLARAAEESIAYQVRDVLDAMRRDSKIKVRNLHADGGPTRDRFLMQFTADVSGVNLGVSAVAESSAWGAAMNGLLGLGIYSSPDAFSQLPHQQTLFRPRMKAAQVKKLHDGWRAAVKRIL